MRPGSPEVNHDLILMDISLAGKMKRDHCHKRDTEIFKDSGNLSDRIFSRISV
jgi:hypothetical protein